MMSNVDRKESKESAVADVDFTESFHGKTDFDPVRPITSSIPAPPPKRFYRTSWRGVVLRAVAAYKKTMHDEANSLASKQSADMQT
jgi:hypothetical protein